MTNIGIYAGGLGDFLMLTPIFKVLRNHEILLYEHPKARRNSRVFDGLCGVSYTSDKSFLICPESSHPHTSQRKMEGLGISHLANCIPKIEITETEKKWAKACLEPFGDCVAFVADNNGSHDPGDLHARHRIYPDWEPILAEYRKRYTVLQFGLSGRVTPFRNVDRVIPDLTIRELAASYWWIGRYLGVDTGDAHLMLAAGGKSYFLVPPPTSFYRWDEYHFTPELWKDEAVRVRYFPFERARECVDAVDFDFKA